MNPSDNNNYRVAFLVPSVELGAYWQPVLSELAKTFKHLVFYTAQVWPAFDPTVLGADVIQLVGEFKFAKVSQTEGGYARGLMILSPTIVFHLLKFRPQLIFTQCFSVWTLLAVLFQPLGRWKIVVIYDGSSPNADFRDSKIRSFLRWLLSLSVTAFLSNSRSGRDYLIEVLKADKERIFTENYLVPDAVALLKNVEEQHEAVKSDQKRPVFLYVGRIKQRKGLKNLLVAFAMLDRSGYRDYTLSIVGTGVQRLELEAYISQHNLQDRVNWIGWVDYGSLGTYFQQADVFVFPSFEDVWGMVVSEAMVFGKPIICSKGAGVSELIVEGENGYVFDPNDPQELADKMQRLLDRPELIPTMGRSAQQSIARTTSVTAATAFVEVADFVLDGQNRVLNVT